MSAELERIGAEAIAAFTGMPATKYDARQIRAVLDAFAREGYSIGKWEQVRRLDITDNDDGSLRAGEPTVPVFRRVDTEKT